MILIEGLKLMLLGMMTVMLFLLLMIFLIEAVAKWNREHTEFEWQQLQQQKARYSSQGRAESEVPIAVFAAAIAAYDAEDS